MNEGNLSEQVEWLEIEGRRCYVVRDDLGRVREIVYPDTPKPEVGPVVWLSR
jgi:hypothetical protein